MSLRSAAMILALCAVFAVGGCSPSSDGNGLTRGQEHLTSRVDEIIKKSGGKWEAVAADDKAYLVKEIGFGDEHNAKMYFLAQSGALRGTGSSPRNRARGAMGAAARTP